MPFGISVKNNQGTIILGENIAPLQLSPEIVTVSPVSTSNYGWAYRPPLRFGSFPAFQMSSDYDSIFTFNHSADIDYPYATVANDFYFNSGGGGSYGDNQGNLTFRYITLGRDLPPASSGSYGIQIYNSNGSLTYDSTNLLFMPENLRSVNWNQTVNIPSNRWIVPFGWFDMLGVIGAMLTTQLDRESGNTFRANPVGGGGVSRTDRACCFGIFQI